MPRPRQISSLKAACVDNLAKHFESYWCSGMTSVLFATPRLMYVIGPFEHLPDSILQQLIQRLVDLKLLRRHHFQLLIHSHVKSLNLGVCDAPANHSSVIDIISTRCQILTSLNISRMKNVPPKALSVLVSNLQFVTSLNLDNTRCDDKVMLCISQTCKRLKDLSVSGCLVKDKGVSNFCVDSVCPELVSFNIGANNVTPDIVASLLESRPKLRYLGFPDVCSALELLYGECYQPGKSVPSDQYHKITTLTATGLDSPTGCVPKRSIQLSVAHCPFLTQVSLFQVTDTESLSHLSCLEHLRALEIGCDMGSFEAGLAPLLVSVGADLLSLSLHAICDVDLVFVGQYCRNLRNLFLSLPDMYKKPNGMYTDTINVNMPCFTHLKELTLIFTSKPEEYKVPEDVMKLMFTSMSNIVFIKLYNVDCISDAVISSAVDKHGFPSLESFTLELCDGLSAHSAHLMIDCDNPLKYLAFHKCRDISLQDTQTLRSQCKTRNLQVEISWV